MIRYHHNVHKALEQEVVKGLEAAGMETKVVNRYKPILGINTDPTRSEGHLCLPKHYSFNIQEAVDMLLSGRFRWYFRRRARITLTGDPEKINQPPVELKEQQLQY